MPPHFTTLPREIRDSILELCLVVEGPINPYPAYYDNPNPFKKADRKPDVALLKVNKAISAEATEMFYGKNTWVLNYEEPRAGDMYLAEDKIWYIHQEHIHHVSLSLDIQDLTPTDLIGATRSAYIHHPEEKSFKARREAAHAYRRQSLRNVCRRKLIMSLFFGLKSLIIDIENLFCSDGCCRIDEIRFCCFHPLQGWARFIKENIANEDGPALPGDWDPKITLVGFLSMADMTAARKVWERRWGPLNHYMNGDQICLEGFFLPREAKHVE